MIYTYDWLEKNGRLGNQLWQIAWQLGQARKNDGDLIVKSNWEYRPFFRVPASFYEEKEGERTDGQTLYYQELHHWDNCVDEVWGMFQPTIEAGQRQRDYLPEVTTKEETCSIHYRMGDYLKNPDHFPIPTKNYYQTAIKRVLETDPDTKFFVFSDDIPAIRRQWEQDRGIYGVLLAEGNVEFVEGTARPVEVRHRKGEPQDWLDLFSMKYCKNHIIGNSTFSWWGAFLSDSRHAYYPSVWWGPALADTPWREGIPATWTEVQC